MSGARVLVQLVRADFLERVRRHSFLVTLGFAVFGAYLFLPPNHARYATLQFAGHRGIYNSAWVGSVVAMLSTIFFGLAGFYLVKNAVERDRNTGVGQILAGTPLPSPLYLLGKLASNFAVLTTMVAVLAVAAGVMQLVRGEDGHLRPLALLSPFMVVTLPVMALVAALAVGFEVAPGLRGGFGNVVYFFLWMFGLTWTASSMRGGVRDPFGMENLLAQMHAACVAAFPDYPSGRGLSMGFNIKSEGLWDLKTFVWEGARWTPAMLGWRAIWVAAAVALTVLATPFFDRFDTSRAAGRRPAGTRRGEGAAPDGAGGVRRVRAAPRPPEPGPRPAPGQAPGPAPDTGAARALARIVERPGSPRLGALVLAELRIMLKGVSRWWTLVALGLVVASLFVPLPAVRQFLAPFALIWPLLCWSSMGTRERRHRTDGLLFSAPRPVSRLLVAQWMAGAGLALAVASGATARLALTGQWSSVAALLVAVGFAPSLALALGIWSGSGKLFEVLYLMLWYVGPMNRVPALDYVGVTQPEAGTGPVAVFLLLTAALVGVSAAGRRRQLVR